MTQERRELVQLAKVFEEGKHRIGGWYISEKLDGTRCLWDGGISRGLPTEQVPWASVRNPKKPEERKEKIKPVATGLWSRYGNPIIAPDWFLDALPPTPLDGELWAGRGNFQTLRSIVAGDEPDPRWDKVRYAVYGCPSLYTITQPGLIKDPNLYCEITDEAFQWAMHLMQDIDGYRFHDHEQPFAVELLSLQETLEDCQVAYCHLQHELPASEAAAIERARSLLNCWVEGGAEGAIVRNPKAVYQVKRVKDLLKLKPSYDDEGTLVGFTAGKGKYAGMIGALVLDYKGKRLELSGMKDAERVFAVTSGPLVGGKDVGVGCIAEKFNVGQKITFTYRELSDDGIPKEARFLRVREEE